ncbi:autotransporter-associated beta strand repeat-containing protein [Bythopirellula goksoeyrii]|uniref:Autotransporter-associated beta strand repeat protein n=1 Tax=Bythopirellula goksoeyrii TaxID=1400387 RepID=A0A5B9QHP4_9BACT|nr:autotransporter-associated beta strand repeat-containing protein [Bythopirellula goksoeyrii]QEG33643.1 Autotransporter-associated beta strand repeat protein [Bythopirellula goksoeyrii]
MTCYLNSLRRLPVVLFILLVCCLVAVPTRATTFTWTGTGTNGNWADPFQWSGFSSPPTNGSNTDIVMQGSDTSPDIQDIFNNNLDYDIDSITLSSSYTGASAMILTGGELTVDNEIVNNDPQEFEFNSVIHMGDQFLGIRPNNGTIDFDSAVEVNFTGSTIAATGGGDVFFDGGISRAFILNDTSLTIFDGTFVRIGGSSSPIGTVNIFDGTLQINSSSNLPTTADVSVSSGSLFDLNNFSESIDRLTGSGSVDLGTATLTTGDTANFSFFGTIFGTGGITKDQSGIMTIEGSNTYSGATSITGGTLRLNGSGQLSSSTDVSVSSGATFDLNGISNQVDSISGAGTILLGGAVLTVDETAGTRNFTGNILESGEMQKNGAGTLSLGGNNTFTLLDINAGTLQVSSAGNLGSGNIELGSGTLQATASFTNARPILINSSTAVINVDTSDTLTQSGVISGSSNFTKLGNGTLSLNASNSHTGDININDGILAISSSNRINDASDITLLAGATFDLNGFSETVDTLSGTGGTVATDGGIITVDENSVSTYTYNGAITGSGGRLTKSGTHTMVLGGSNTYTGVTTINGGTLRLGSANRISNSSDLVVNGSGTFDLNNFTEAVDSITGSGLITLGSGTLTVVENSASTRTFSGSITGTGSLAKNGSHTLVLTGNNTFSGELSLSGGTLSVGASNNLGNTGANIVFFGGTLQTTGSFDNVREVFIGPFNSATFEVDTSTTLTQSDFITGDSTTTLNKTGGGTFVLSSASSGFGGLINITGGTFQFGSGDTVANSTDVTVAGGATFSLTQTEGIDALNGVGNVTIASGQLLEVGLDNSSSSFSGIISGANGQFSKAGNGVLTLSGSNTYTGSTSINGGTIMLSGAGRLADATDVNVTSGATFDLNNVSDAIDALTGAGAVTLGAGSSNTLTIGSNNGSGTFSGNISETGALTKVGSGTQTLSGNNTYSGTTSFDGGVLRTASTANLGSGNISFGGGTWEVTGSFTNSRQILFDIGVSGTINVDPGVTLTQSGTVFGGLSTLNKTDSGTLLLTASASPQNMNVNGGLLQFSGSGSLATGTNVTVDSGATWNLNGLDDSVATIAGAGSIQLNGFAELTVGANSPDTTFSGVISGNGLFIKDGNHRLTLSGTNTYSAGTRIDGGTLAISSDANLGNLGSPLIINNGILETANTVAINRNVYLFADEGTIATEGGLNLTTIAGLVEGDGTLIKSGNAGLGALVLTNNNTYTGGTIVETGTLTVSSNLNLGANAGGVTLMNGSVLNSTGTFTNLHSVTLDGGGGITVAGSQTLTQAIGIGGTGTLTKSGTGTLLLTAPATHAGNTIINAGTLQFGSGELPDAFDVTVDGAGDVWDLNGVSDAIDGLFGGGTVLLGGGTLTVGSNDGDGDFSGSIQETGSFVKIGPGTQILSGANTYVGSTQVLEGKLEITNDASLGDPSSTLLLSDGTLRTNTTFSTGRTTTIVSGSFETAPGTTLTFTSPIAGAGPLFKRETGTLELTQSNTYSGATNIFAGTLQLSGAGQLADTTDVLLAAQGTFDLTDLVDTIDSLSGSGSVALGNGTLTIGADNGAGNFSGIISGTGIGGEIVKEGAGTQVFSGANTYAGGTEINDGTLEISQDANLGELGGQVTFDGGTLHTTANIPNMVREMTVNSGDGTIEVDAATTLGIGGNIAGVGELTKTGDGTLTLSGISSYDGTNLLGGVLSVGFNFNLGTASGQLTIDGATLHTSNNFTTSRVTTIGPSGATFDVDEVLPGADHTHNGTIQGNAGANPFVKTGLGEMRLGSANTFIAPIHINQGKLSVNASNQLGSSSNAIAFGGGTWFVDGTFSNSRVVQLNQNGGTIEVAGGFSLTQNGVIEDGVNGPAGSLNKTGSGNLLLGTANTYSSGTNIQSGLLRLNSGGRLPDTTDVDVAASATWDLNNVSDAIDGLSGSGDVTLGSGELTVGSDDGGGTFSGTISETGSLVKVGIGTQFLRLNEVGEDTFPNTYTGGTQINGGTLDIEEDDNLGDPGGPLSFDGGTLQVAGNNGVSTSRLVTLNAGGGTVNTVGDNSLVTFSGVIDGAGFLRKNGQGTLTLAADNTYTGDTIVNSGILRLDGAGRIPDASYVTVEASGSMGEGLDLNDISDTIGGLEGSGDIHLGTATLTVGAAGGDFDGTIDGTGGVAKIGAGNLILAGVNTYMGGTAINGGSIEIGFNANLGNAAGPLSFDGGTLTTLGNFSTARATTMNAGGGTFNVPGSNTFTHNANIAGVGGLGKAGTGTLVLNAVSSYGGPTSVTGGTLQLGGSERLPNSTSLSVSAPGVFDLNNFNETIDGLSGNGSVDLTNAQLTVGISGGGGSFSGVVSGTGDLQKEGAGTQTLAGGTHTFSGATVVNGGELILNGGGSIDQTTLSVGFNNGSDGTTTVTDSGTMWDVSGNLTVGAQGIGRLNINNSANMTVGGQVLIGAGIGTGTLLVDGGTLDNSAGTGILVQDGTLGGSGDVLGNIINQDTVSPGTSAGILDLTGTYVQEITGLFSAEIGGTGAGQFDVLNVSSTASLAGNLELGILGFQPAPSDTFSILTAGTLVGEFGNVADGARLNITSGGTGSFQVDYNATSVILSDFQGTAVTTGDFDFDGDVDGRDFLVWQRGGSPNGINSGDLALWQAEYGNTLPLTATNTTVPEPTGLFCAIALVVALVASPAARLRQL